MKIIFFGTPDYAVPALKAIINSRHEVVAVVSQPDKAKVYLKQTESLLRNIIDEVF